MARKQSARSAEWYADETTENATENKVETTQGTGVTPVEVGNAPDYILNAIEEIKAKEKADGVYLVEPVKVAISQDGTVNVIETQTKAEAANRDEALPEPDSKPISKPAEKGTRNKLTAAIEAYINRAYINGLVTIKTKPEQMGRYYGAVDILRIMGYTVDRKANRHTVKK